MYTNEAIGFFHVLSLLFDVILVTMQFLSFFLSVRRSRLLFLLLCERLCVSNGVTFSSQCSYRMLLLSCCRLSTLLLFDSCKDVDTFHSSSLWTLAALPVAILVGVPEFRGGVRTRVL